MNTIHRNIFHTVALPVILLVALLAVLAGCERAGQSADPTGNQAAVDQPVGQERPLSQVTEFEAFTLRANVSRTEFLPEAMVRQYNINAAPDVVLLNVVVSENRSDLEPAPVSARVSAQYQNQIGQVEVIDMRAAEADGYVSYIGTLDASGQRVFQLVIEAQPAGTDESLRMDFEVHLDTLGSE